MRILMAGLVGALMMVSASSARAAGVDVPSGIDHESWDSLLKKYVNERGFVDYAGWKSSAEDLKALRDYTAQFDRKDTFAEGDEKAASLINAYNALTIQWILENYPTPSIQSLKNSFGAERHTVGGRKVSLDDIEHRTLRPLVGYRVHATLVCAARSCPPLRREAYRAETLEAQLDDSMRRWLARDDLNRFEPERRRVELSSIFSWFREDFDKAGGVKAVLAKYPPEQHAEFLRADYTIAYMPYNWGLNDQGELGKDYSWRKRIWDGFLDIFR